MTKASKLESTEASQRRVRTWTMAALAAVCALWMGCAATTTPTGPAAGAGTTPNAELMRQARAEALSKTWAEKMIKPHLAGKEPLINEAAQKRAIAEFRSLGAPATVDVAAMRANIVGHWMSPRRGYTYRADGTFATDDGTTGQTWAIHGNRFFISGKDAGRLVIVSRKYFVYFDERGVFFLMR